MLFIVVIMSAPNSFNSYMVRFKDAQRLLIHIVFHVSIPIWFDLKTAATLHYSKLNTCFNSYMVRFKAGDPSYRCCHHLCVSIPIWFDLKLVPLAPPLELWCFNSYMVRFKGRSARHLTFTAFLFQFLYGSI